MVAARTPVRPRHPAQTPRVANDQMRPNSLDATVIGLLTITICTLISVPVLAAPEPKAIPSSGRLELRVLDAESGEPVPWANLVTTNRSGGYLADGEGVFRLRVPAGALTFRVVHVSYLDSPEFRVLIPPDGTTSLEVELQPHVHSMSKVEIRVDVDDSPRERTRGIRFLRAEETAALPNPTDDVFRMIQVLPSVAAGDMGSRFHLRGGGPDQMLVRVDGMDVREFFHGRDFGGITSIVPAGAIESMDVYPAGFPAEFGGRLSGAVNLELLSGGGHGLHGRASADATSARLLMQSNSRTGSVLVSAREAYLDRILDWIQEDAVIRPAYRDLLFHAVYHPNPTRSISFNYLRSEDHAFYEDHVATHFVNADYMDDYVWTTYRMLLASRWAVSGTLHSARSEQHREFRIDDRIDQETRRVGGRFQSSLSLGEHLLIAGVQRDHERGDFAFRADSVVTVIIADQVIDVTGFAQDATFDRVLSAAWLQDEWRALDRLTLHLGGRMSWDSETMDSYFGPRLSASYAVGDGTTIRGYWGFYDQPAPRGPTGDQNVQILTDQLQTAEHRGVGVEGRVHGFRVGLDAYEKIFHRLDGIVTRTIGGTQERHVVTEGTSRGIEAFVQRDGERSNWWFAYTLGRSDWTDGVNTFTRDFDRLHSFSVANTFRMNAGWDLGFNYTFHTGSPYTAEEWRVKGSSDWILTEGFPNAERLPDYHRVDLRIRRHFRFDTWRMSVYAEALNLTNHPNVLWYAWRQYDESGRLDGPERLTRKGIPGIPSVGLEISF